MIPMKEAFEKTSGVLLALTACLALAGGGPAYASTSSDAETTLHNYFHVSQNTAAIGSPNYVIPGGDYGSGCGGGARNTGWVNYYSSDRSALLQMCSFDDGGHTMVTHYRLYTLIPSDYISSAYAVGTWDDGAHDADYVKGQGGTAYGTLEHTFANAGSHTISLQGGFYSVYSQGYWEQNQSLYIY